MKNKNYLVVAIILAGVFLIGLVSFSGNGLSATPYTCTEKLNQAIPIIYTEGSGGFDGGFVAPVNERYNKVKFLSFGAITWSSVPYPGNFTLNGVDCGEINRRPDALNDFTDACLDALKDGLNSFTLNPYYNERVYVKEILVEMEITSANCQN